MLDTLMVAELAKGMPEAEIVSCVDGYLEIGGMIDEGLKQQAAVRPCRHDEGERPQAAAKPSMRRSPSSNTRRNVGPSSGRA